MLWFKICIVGPSLMGMGIPTYSNDDDSGKNQSYNNVWGTSFRWYWVVAPVVSLQWVWPYWGTLGPRRPPWVGQPSLVPRDGVAILGAAWHWGLWCSLVGEV